MIKYRRNQGYDTTEPKQNQKIFSKNFEKTIDKFGDLCYNIYVIKVRGR